MYILFILFFVSLFAIIIIIERKLILVGQNRELNNLDIQNTLSEIPIIKELKVLTIRKLKKYVHIGLIIGVRIYVKTNNLISNTYQDLKTKIKEKLLNKHINGEKKEISKFLKIISDYKHKIRVIKHRIHEEEKVL
jgi:hypothetical protein